jgi:hypothetical protein
VTTCRLVDNHQVSAVPAKFICREKAEDGGSRFLHSDGIYQQSYDEDGGKNLIRNVSAHLGKVASILNEAQTGPKPHQAPCIMVKLSSPGVNRPGRGVDQPPPSRVKVKERVQLYIY